MHKPLPPIEILMSRKAKEVSEISQVHFRAGLKEFTVIGNSSAKRCNIHSETKFVLAKEIKVTEKV